MLRWAWEDKKTKNFNKMAKLVQINVKLTRSIINLSGESIKQVHPNAILSILEDELLSEPEETLEKKAQNYLKSIQDTMNKEAVRRQMEKILNGRSDVPIMRYELTGSLVTV
jgi:ABC-type cobalamin transport system ATPase subunit